MNVADPPRAGGTIGSTLVSRMLGAPWALRVSAVYLLSRALTTTLLLLHAQTQPITDYGRSPVSYPSIASAWDAAWYQWVAYHGYPSELPLDAEGRVQQNAWAFLPVYPLLVRALSELTGVAWEQLAVTVSVLAAWAAALMLYKMLALRLDASTAFFAVVLFCIAPLSPVLQIGYAEALQLFLLVTGLYLLIRRRYGWLFPLTIVLALTRPTGLALALMLGMYWLYRLRHRRGDPFERRENGTVIALGVTSLAAALAWPALAAAVTGSLTAYTDTELSWRAAYIGPQQLLPFTPWLQAADWWFGFPLGLLILVAVLAAFAALLFSPAMRRLGPELRLWCIAYALYLLAFFFPQSSVFRLLMPLFPMLGVLAAPRSLWYRIPLSIAMIAGQWWWMQACLHLGTSTWWVP